MTTKQKSIKMNKFLESNKEKVINTYHEVRSYHKTAKIFSISPVTLYKFLKQNNVETGISNSQTSYKLIDDKFLDDINFQWKAYYLGLFYADGNLFKSCMRITLIDREILEMLNKKIFVNREIKTHKSKNINHQDTYLLMISNKYVSDRMRKIGLYENKSLTISFPEIILNSKYLTDFIRGYFDGDGGVSKCFKYKGKNKISYDYSISICVSKNFGPTLKNILNNLNIQCYLKPHDRVYKLMIGKNEDKFKFYDLIYSENSEFYLKRKRDSLNEFKKQYFDFQNNKTSQYKGIYFDKSKNKNTWTAKYQINKRNKHIGSFKTELEAFNGRQKFLLENNLI